MGGLGGLIKYGVILPILQRVLRRIKLPNVKHQQRVQRGFAKPQNRVTIIAQSEHWSLNNTKLHCFTKHALRKLSVPQVEQQKSNRGEVCLRNIQEH